MWGDAFLDGDVENTATRGGPAHHEHSPVSMRSDALRPTAGRVAGKCRTWGTLAAHFVAFFTTVTTGLFFGLHDNPVSCVLISLPWAFSGAFCTYTAWYCSSPNFKFLPLSEQRWPVRLFLAFPLGLLQGIVVVLFLDEFKAQFEVVDSGMASTDSTGGNSRPAQNARKQKAAGIGVSNLKAVNGCFEGILSALVVLYNYWGIGFPSSTMPLTPFPTDLPEDWNARRFLAILGLLLFCYGGLGLLELDRSVSPKVARRMVKSRWYEMGHYLFRLCEVIMRISGLTAFMVLTRRSSRLWWCPLAADFVLVFSIVYFCGGSEVYRPVRVLCATPCIFANVFRFVESPSKKAAANKISFLLEMRNILEILFVGILFAGYSFRGHASLPGHLINNFHKIFWRHPPTSIASVTALCLYFPLYIWMLSKWRKELTLNIYNACQTLDVESVRTITRENPIGMDVNSYNIDGVTALLLAVQALPIGSMKCCQRDGNSNQTGQCTDKCRKCAEICRLLIREGARLDRAAFKQHRRLGDWTSLHLCASRGCPTVLRTLLSQPTLAAWIPRSKPFDHQPAYLDKQGNTPLHIAVMHAQKTSQHEGHLACVAELVSACPAWKKIRNAAGYLPAELPRARSDILMAIDSGQQQPIIPHCHSSFPAQHEEQPERPVTMPILRGTGKRTDIGRGANMAPGICSHVASVAGGPLGQFFCHVEPSAYETEPEEEDHESQHEDTFAQDNEFESLDLYDLDPVDRYGQPCWDVYRPPPPDPSPVGSRVQERKERRPSGPATPSCVAPFAAPLNNFRVAFFEVVDGFFPSEAIPGGAARTGAMEAGVMAAARVARGTGSSQKRKLTNKTLEREVRRIGIDSPEAKLGQGAFGFVWRAKSCKTGKKYAVKNVETHRDKTRDSIAVRECEVADRLKVHPHPCVVHLHHVRVFEGKGNAASLHVLVMEFCAGGNLLNVLEERRNNFSRQAYQPPLEARHWLAQIMLGLEHLNEVMQVLFRDLKPDNVVLTESGRAKLTDFGLGRCGTESPGVWSFQFPTGTPGYIAPEILREQRHDKKSDLYSFGVLAWVVLTGGDATQRIPQPPIGPSAHVQQSRCCQSAHGYTQHARHLNDYQLIWRKVNSPNRGEDNLSPDARDLIRSLVHRYPRSRSDYRQIRRHNFFQTPVPLRIPEAACTGAKKRELEGWLTWLDESGRDLRDRGQMM